MKNAISATLKTVDDTHRPERAILIQRETECRELPHAFGLLDVYYVAQISFRRYWGAKFNSVEPIEIRGMGNPCCQIQQFLNDFVSGFDVLPEMLHHYLSIQVVISSE
jgi:hypothetical protein